MKMIQSVSAFAPLCHPSMSSWGDRPFKAYFGDNRDIWRSYDATELIRSGAGRDLPGTILIDQVKLNCIRVVFLLFQRYDLFVAIC
jgi:S-formylglutathione hydrolase